MPSHPERTKGSITTGVTTPEASSDSLVAPTPSRSQQSAPSLTAQHNPGRQGSQPTFTRYPSQVHLGSGMTPRRPGIKVTSSTLSQPPPHVPLLPGHFPPLFPEMRRSICCLPFLGDNGGQKLPWSHLYAPAPSCYWFHCPSLKPSSSQPGPLP